MLIFITRNVAIKEDEIKEEFIRSSGPGGQNVNKVSTAVRLSFDIKGTTSLSDAIKKRMIRLAGKGVTQDGVLIIIARRFRSQEKNRQDVRNRLFDLIRKASEKPAIRKRTKPSLTSKKRRLEDKRRQSQKKKLRRDIYGR